MVSHRGEGMQSFCERLVKAVNRNFNHHQNGEPKRENGGIGEIRLNKEVAEVKGQLQGGPGTSKTFVMTNPRSLYAHHSKDYIWPAIRPFPPSLWEVFPRLWRAERRQLRQFLMELVPLKKSGFLE